MKTKLLFSVIQKFKNGIKRNGFFTFLILFFMTVSSYSQSDGISFTFTCVGAISGGTISFGAPSGEVNGYPYWNNGNEGTFVLFFQTLNGINRWELHEAGESGFPDGDPDPVLGYGVVFFASSDLNGISPDCEGSWTFVYPHPEIFTCTITTVTCTGEPIEVCPTYYADTDGDGFGDPDTSTDSCDGAPNDYVEDNTDCDDTIANINPDTVWYIGVDGDSDTYVGSVTSLVQCESPGTGYSTTEPIIIDCNDNNAAINPEADEVPYNGIDDDCNSATLDDDLDQDGYVNADDCDDLEYEVYLGAPEICDGLDNNCDGQIDEGIDGCIDGVIIEYCDDKQKKILVCHNGKTKCISINAMDAHLAHGDYLGTCGGNSKQGEVLVEDTPTSYDVVSWPNPTNDLFNIKMITPNYEDKVNLQAFDINGRLIHSNIINGNEDYQFGTNIESGVYFVKVTQANTAEVIKVIKR